MNDPAAAVRRDMEATRERMSDALSEIGQRVDDMKEKANLKRQVTEFVTEHPWIALGVAAGAGALLAASRADARVARATMSTAGAAARKAPAAVRAAPKAAAGKLADVKTKVGDAVDSAIHARLHAPVRDNVDKWVAELVEAIGPNTLGR